MQLDAEDVNSNAILDQRFEHAVLRTFDVKLQQVDAIVPQLVHQTLEAPADGEDVPSGCLQVTDRVRRMLALPRLIESLLAIVRPQAVWQERNAACHEHLLCVANCLRSGIQGDDVAPVALRQLDLE
jgi:hypothetical protein